MSPRKPKARRGQLVWTGRNWSGRVERGAKLVPLHTSDKTLAQLRLDELITAHDAGKPTVVRSGPETFRAACVRICAAAERDGMVTAEQRRKRLEKYTWPSLGTLPVTEIRSGQISSVLAGAAQAGLSQQTVRHLQVDLVTVFGELVRDEILERNPATSERVRIPRGVVDTRPRTLLTDDEFLQLVQAPTTQRQIRVMAWVSRAFGGLRPSDMHAWQWADIDRETWSSALAPRRKTERGAKRAGRVAAARERLQLPPEVAAELQAWWEFLWKPEDGPVFPRELSDPAAMLRRDLLKAGVTRHELHHDTDTSLRTDFYSLRRAFVTALAGSGVNMQTAMRAAGHKNPSTHMRYELRDVIVIPEGAVPRATVVGADDFDTALAEFDPNCSLHNSTCADQSSADGHRGLEIGDFPRVFAISDTEKLTATGSHDSRPAAPNRNEIRRQVETEMSWFGTWLQLFASGPE